MHFVASFTPKKTQHSKLWENTGLAGFAAAAAAVVFALQRDGWGPRGVANFFVVF